MLKSTQTFTAHRNFTTITVPEALTSKATLLSTIQSQHQQEIQILSKSSQLINTLIDQNIQLTHSSNTLSTANQTLKQQISILRKQLQEKINDNLLKNSKNEQLQKCLKQSEKKYQKEIEEKIGELQSVKKEKDEQLKNKDKKIEELEACLEKEREQNSKNIEKMIEKYEGVIQEKVKMIEQDYYMKVQQINQNNARILRQLEIQQSNLKKQASQKQKEKFSSYQILVEENKKLLSQSNQYKKKILNLQTEIQTIKQQFNIARKQHQFKSETLSKEISLHREQKSQYQEKIRKLTESFENCLWKIKEMEISHEREKKQNIEAGQTEKEELYDLVGTFKEQITQLKQEIKSRQSQRQHLDAKIAQMSLSIKEKNVLIDEMRAEKQQRGSNKSLIKGDQQKERLQLTIQEYKKQIIRKNAQIQIFKEEIGKLKSKIKKISSAFEEFVKSKEIIEQQNKMLLSQIVFLRDKGKNSRIDQTNKSKISGIYRESRSRQQKSQILNLQSQESRDDGEELEMYKELIAEMEKDMQEALQKINEKNDIIERQKAIIQRLERAIG